METVNISEPSVIAYKKYFFTALSEWRNRLGIDYETELLGYHGHSIVEIDAFYFGKNKIAAGINNQARFTTHRICLVFCERCSKKNSSMGGWGNQKRN